MWVGRDGVDITEFSNINVMETRLAMGGVQLKNIIVFTTKTVGGGGPTTNY